MLKRYYKNMFRSPAALTSIVALFLFSFVPIVFKNSLNSFGITFDAKDKALTLFDQFYLSFFHINIAATILYPLYALFCQHNRIFFQNESVIIRFDNNFSYWKKRILYLILDTTVFVFFVHILLLIRLIFFGETKALVDSAYCYLYLIPLNITGFLIFGLIFQFAYALFGNTALSFFCSYIFVLYDFVAFTFILPPLFVIRAVSVKPELLYANIMNLFIMLICICILCAFFVFLLSDRDCLIPKENKEAA